MPDSLRDALEQLVSEREAEGGSTPSDYAISPHEVRELLAAHPVEPVPVASAPRPVVDREALVKALTDAYTNLPRTGDFKRPPRRLINFQADAVLALLNGTA